MSRLASRRNVQWSAEGANDNVFLAETRRNTP